MYLASGWGEESDALLLVPYAVSEGKKGTKWEEWRIDVDGIHRFKWMHQIWELQQELEENLFGQKISYMNTKILGKLWGNSSSSVPMIYHCQEIEPISDCQGLLGFLHKHTSDVENKTSSNDSVKGWEL